MNSGLMKRSDNISMDTSHIMRQTAMEYRKRVCRAMNYISRNLDRDLSLEEIAAVAAFSRFHFHRIFKAMVGETVAGFTRRLRIEMAANRLLSNPLEDVTTIAMECGFSSSQNFAKAFRQRFNTTPTRFRKSKIGNKYRNGENALSLAALYDPDTAFTNQGNMRTGLFGIGPVGRAEGVFGIRCDAGRLLGQPRCDVA